MSIDFKLPDLGEGVHEGQIVRVLVREGDVVREDQPLMEVETDKAAVEIPSPRAGRIEKVHVQAGQVVNVGQVMITYGEASASAPASRGPAASAAGNTPAHSPPITSSTASPSPAVSSRRFKPASPAVRAKARKLGLDLNAISGSGPAGRVTQADLERAVASAAEEKPQSSRTSASTALSRAEAPRTAVTPSHTPASIERGSIEGTPDSDSWGAIIRSPLSRPRKAIADAMIKSVSSIPHVTDTDDADVTEMDRLRRGYESPDSPRKLTILPFAIRAVAVALSRHPLFNASYDHEKGEIIHHQYISIAIGVHTDRGLIAPVLRNVDQMSIAQIADELNVLAENARSARFQVNDTRGGTFTVSNAGAMGGSRYSTPIINHPQSAVLALGRTKWMPWVVDQRIEPRFILPLSLSFDHRIIDGGTSIPFLQEIVQLLQNPARLLL